MYWTSPNSVGVAKLEVRRRSSVLPGKVTFPSKCLILPSYFRVDLAQLVEEATEGCWIGHRARHSSEIGSVYSPRNDEDAAARNVRLRSHVETVVDIDHRSQVRA